jgi:hypothetical protein
MSPNFGPSVKMSLRNGPSPYSPSKKCPLLSKCPFNKPETMINYNVNSQVKESYNESDRIPSVGIRWDPSVGIRRKLLVGFDRPLLPISSFNKLVPGANFKGPSKPTDRFCRISTLGSYRISSVIGSHI